MAPLFEVVYLFSAEDGYLAEIRRMDRDASAHKSDIYQWLWLEDGAARSLQFVAMASAPMQQRVFREAQLSFDDKRGELRWVNGEPIALVAETDKNLPASITQLVNNHLS